MEQEIRKQFAKFLSEYPLYRKFKIPDDRLTDTYSLHGITFLFHCKVENSIQTFELNMTPKKIYEYYGQQSSNQPMSRSKITKDGLFFDVQHFKGVCSSCKEFAMELLLLIYTEEKLKVNGPEPNIFYLKKLGQYPPYEKDPPKEILDYLKIEDQNFYKKALMNVSTGYGIGAFSYFRRIIENEILKLIEDISDLDNEDSATIKNALSEYSSNHRMSTLIEALNDHLPSSLKSLGTNPIKVLYEESSIAIHSLSEDECLDKAELIDTILRFTIKKIREESKDIREVKKALKSLTTPKT